MAMIAVLQRALSKQCHGLKPRALPVVAQLRTSPGRFQLSFVKNCKITVPKVTKCYVHSLKIPSYIHFPKEIHTSPVRKAIPPIIWIFLRPFLNVFVIFFGKYIKRRWKQQPPEKRSAFWKKTRDNWISILGVFGVLGIYSFLYYHFHLEHEPLTNRTRFMMLHNKDMEELTNKLVEQLALEHADRIIPKSHPQHRKVEQIMKQITAANSDILRERNISEPKIMVVNAPVMNAVVFPNSSVLIFQGIFALFENDDQLAAVLSHELAHAVLNHQAEMISQEQVIDTLVLLTVLLAWATLPDFAGVLWHFASKFLSQVYITLPFSREMELEADAIGLQLMAKACYDVRESAVVWGKLGHLEEMGVDYQPKEILSTHPTHKKRQQTLEELIPAAMELRNSCKCARLPWTDPKLRLELWKRNFVPTVQFVVP